MPLGLFAGRGVQSIAISMCIYLSVHSHISETAQPNFTPNVLYTLTVDVAWPSSGGVVIHYVLPVLWMT